MKKVTCKKNVSLNKILRISAKKKDGLKGLLFTVVLLFSNYYLGQAPVISWDKTIGGIDADRAKSIKQLADGTLMVGATSYSFQNGDKTVTNYSAVLGSSSTADFWIYSLKENGTLESGPTFSTYQRPQLGYGGLNNEELHELLLTKDKGFLFAGSAEPGAHSSTTMSAISNGQFDNWLIKLNDRREEQWQRCFGGDLNDYIVSVAELEDGSFILAGTSNSNASGDKSESSNGHSEYWVLKIDKDGEKIWDKTIHTESVASIGDMKITQDGGILLLGETLSDPLLDKSSPNYGYYDYWVVKLDSEGEIEWENSYGGSGEERGESIALTEDGGFLIGGNSESGISGNKTTASFGEMDYWVLKISSTGAIEWQESYGGITGDFLTEIIPWDDGFILGGSSNSGVNGNKTSANKGGLDYWILKIDQSGQILWQKNYGGSSDEALYNLVSVSKWGLVLAGTSQSPISGDKTEGTRGTSGRSDSWIVYLTYQNKPEACVKTNTPLSLVNEQVFFDASCSRHKQANRTLVNYEWDFDNDGVFDGTGINTTHAYSQTGTYQAKVRVTDDLGETDSAFIRVDIQLGIENHSFIGGPQFDEAIDLAVSNNGYQYLLGTFQDSLDVNPSTDVQMQNGIPFYTSFFHKGALIQKINPSGELTWAKSIQSYYLSVNSIEVDAQENVFVMGSAYGSASTFTDMDPGPNVLNPFVTGKNSFILKLDLNGDLLWCKTFGSATLRSLEIDHDGNVLFSGGFGQFEDSTDVDPGPNRHMLYVNPTFNQGDDIFFVKWTNDGDFLWANSYRSFGQDIGEDITVDSQNNILVTGWFQNAITFDPSTSAINSNGFTYSDIFVLKVNPDGDFIWVKYLGADRGDGGKHIQTDSENNVYVTGQYTYTVDFDPGTGIVNQIGYNAANHFCLKLDSDGNYVWVKTIPAVNTNSYAIESDLFVDVNKNVYVSGLIDLATVDMNPGTGVYNMTPTKKDGFLYKLDSLGNFIFSKQLAGALDENIVAIETSPDGERIYFAGNYIDNARLYPALENYQLTARGYQDYIYANIASTGASQFTTLNVSACDQITLQGNTFTSSGTYSQHFASSVGQDSVVVTNFTINHSSTNQITENICGTSFTSPSGEIWTSSGTYYDTIPNANSCDSILIYTLNLGGTVSNTIDSIVCNEYLSHQGEIWTSSGTYVDSLLTTLGCDSLVTVNLTVLMPQNIIITGLPGTILNTDLPVTLVGTPTGGIFSGSGISSDTFDPSIAGLGTQTIYYTYVDGGCSKIDSQTVIINNGATYNFDLILTTIYDGPLTGSTPKGVELFVGRDIPDLSIYGLGSANNGGGTDGQEFTFPAISVTAGTFLYVASESTEFTNFIGFAPTFTSGSMAINGDDAIELFKNGVVIDVFGDINTDGTGQVWEYVTSWASRNNCSQPSGGNFSSTQWTYGGINILSGETTNASASTPIPIGNYICLTNCTATYGTDVQTACESYVWIDGNTYNSSNNSATFTLTNAVDCDSIVTLNLTITAIDPSVTLAEPDLTANISGANYQWVNCLTGNSPIIGATAQTFTATTSGEYAVIINDGTCEVMSDCINVNLVNIDEQVNNSNLILYPNPSNGKFIIKMDKTIDSYEITNSLGQIISSKTEMYASFLEFNLELNPGVYFIQINSGTEIYSTSIVIK